MKPSLDQCNAFLAGKPLPGVRLRHNDHVQVIAGEHAGDSGSVVSVDELTDDPLIRVELESGYDALIVQSRLKLSASSSAQMSGSDRL